MNRLGSSAAAPATTPLQVSQVSIAKPNDTPRVVDDAESTAVNHYAEISQSTIVLAIVDHDDAVISSAKAERPGRQHRTKSAGLSLGCSADN